MLEQLAILTFLGAILSISLGLGDAQAAVQGDRKSTCLNSSHVSESRMPSSA